MTTERFSPQVASSRKRMLASTLLLALGLVSSPLWAAQDAKLTTGTGSTPHSEPVNEVSSSRINGRSDWDIDYPSQLAPQLVRPAGQVSAVAHLPLATPTQTLNISGSAPAPAAD